MLTNQSFQPLIAPRVLLDRTVFIHSIHTPIHFLAQREIKIFAVLFDTGRYQDNQSSVNHLRGKAGLLLTLIGIGHAQTISLDIGPRTIRRTAMIEKGREIIMEEVVFDHLPNEVSRAKAVQRGKPECQPRQSGAALAHQSYVVQPQILPNGLSLVSWWPTEASEAHQRFQCWSNLDWSILGLGISFSNSKYDYSIIVLPTLLDPDQAKPSVKNPPRWLRSLSKRRPRFHFLKPKAKRRFEAHHPALQFMRSLHRHAESNQEELKTELAERNATSEQHRRERQASRERPRDLIIRFGLKSPAIGNGKKFNAQPSKK